MQIVVKMHHLGILQVSDIAISRQLTERLLGGYRIHLFNYVIRECPVF